MYKKRFPSQPPKRLRETTVMTVFKDLRVIQPFESCFQMSIKFYYGRHHLGTCIYISAAYL